MTGHHIGSRRACPVCRAQHATLIRTMRFVLPEGHPLASEYGVVYCEGCGFVYADTPASPRAYDDYYSGLSKYADPSVSTGGGVTPWDLSRLQETAALVASLLNNKQASILDIGCANGGLLASLWSLGYTNLCGIDPSLRCVEFVRARLGIEAHAGTLSSVPGELGQFDCIVASHVLEHVLDLRGALQRLSQLTKEDGAVYAEVPDAERYVDFLVAPFQEFNVEHVNHFSLESLIGLFRACGWEPRASGRRLITVARGLHYPVVFAFLKKQRVDRPGSPIVSGASLRAAMKSYVGRSQSLLDSLDATLRRRFGPGDPVIVWGTGALASRLLAETCLGKADMKAFVDSNPVSWGKALAGAPIIPPHEAKNWEHPILVASILHSDEILRTIRADLRLPNEVVLINADGLRSYEEGELHASG